MINLIEESSISLKLEEIRIRFCQTNKWRRHSSFTNYHNVLSLFTVQQERRIPPILKDEKLLLKFIVLFLAVWVRTKWKLMSDGVNGVKTKNSKRNISNLPPAPRHVKHGTEKWCIPSLPNTIIILIKGVLWVIYVMFFFFFLMLS
jgi:hypothetical protein